MSDDLKFLKTAVDLARKSLEHNIFPSGALTVRDGKVLSQHMATPFPKSNLHGDSKCIDETMDLLNEPLEGCTLYSSMEPCLMCFSRAYWAGLSRFVYVVPKSKLPSELCYESDMDDLVLVKKFHRKCEIVQDDTYVDEVLELFSEWQSKLP